MSMGRFHLQRPRAPIMSFPTTRAALKSVASTPVVLPHRLDPLFTLTPKLARPRGSTRSSTTLYLGNVSVSELLPFGFSVMYIIISLVGARICVDVGGDRTHLPTLSGRRSPDHAAPNQRHLLHSSFHREGTEKPPLRCHTSSIHAASLT